ncbi:MAG: 5-(carboxyamino)imidazole ribonucleotide synthase [Deltaproteobacteria bacterium]|nr:5-(carboxyamino)imidazole ribonucleotide synthase [Deltaproteobacteria bacterium]
MKMIAPGSCIGIIGGGQLARMMILEGRKMGYRFIVVDPSEQCASAAIVDELIIDKWSSLNAALTLAKKCDVVTVDTEHVPWQSIQAMEEITHVFPSSMVLKNIQDRLAQRQFLQNQSIPQTAFYNVESLDDIHAAMDEMGLPCVLKTKTSGYDGKGQSVIRELEDALFAWEKIGRLPAIIEKFVDFQDEVSVIIARTKVACKVQVSIYPIAKNLHYKHILHKTVVPSGYDGRIEEKCKALAMQVVDAFDYIGVMGIEMFVTKDGEVLVNELAPRTHNSGHFTYGGCMTSQFEQHIRAVTGQALGATTLLSPIVMVNLLGDLWDDGIDFSKLVQTPHTTLHLYGKTPPQKGRKMGHFTVFDAEVEKASAIADDLYNEL